MITSLIVALGLTAPINSEVVDLSSHLIWVEDKNDELQQKVYLFLNQWLEYFVVFLYLHTGLRSYLLNVK